MIDFATLQGLTIPEGLVTQITDASGRVLWELPISGEPIVLEVEKITSNTYVSSTSYTSEQFILLDIYPKTNGTVKVTYGGLTKTITDTSGAEEPNAQQVYFGKFGGVSDSVTTPASGTLTITGECAGFGCGSFSTDKSTNSYWAGITAINAYGTITQFPSYAFGTLATACDSITDITIPESVVYIGPYAFVGCTNLESVTFENTDGWYCVYYDAERREDVTEWPNLDDPVRNVSLLQKQFNTASWYRS